MKKTVIFCILLLNIISCGGPENGNTELDGVLSSEHRVFVSSASYDGKFLANSGALTGLDAADRLCLDLAKAAGLVRNYKAILSSSTKNAKDRLSFTGAVYIVKGTQKVKIVEAGNDLWGTDSKDLLFSINIDESGTTVATGTKIWTGTDSSGTVDTDHCTNWTVNSGATGSYGETDYTDQKWLFTSSSNCSTQNRLYCISQ